MLNTITQKLTDLDDYRNAELYGHAVVRQLCRAAGMTYEQVIDDLDAAALSRDRLALREFIKARECPNNLPLL